LEQRLERTFKMPEVDENYDENMVDAPSKDNDLPSGISLADLEEANKMIAEGEVVEHGLVENFVGVDPAKGADGSVTNVNVTIDLQVVKKETIEDDDILIIHFPKGVTQEALPILTQQFKENFPNNNLMFTDDTLELRVLHRKPGKTVEEVIEEAGIALDNDQ